MSAGAALGDRAHTAALARALAEKAVLAFQTVPDGERGPALAALDRFLAGPAPSTFLAAVRELSQARRRVLIERTASATLQRARADGLRALRDVPGLPATLIDRLQADLPLDVRSGQRLLALAALARAYDELEGRVAADNDEMRQRLREAFPRRSGRTGLPRTRPKRLRRDAGRVSPDRVRGGRSR